MKTRLSYSAKCLFFCGVIFYSLFVGLKNSECANELRANYKDYNVILIFIDALRADHLGCYGYHRNTSPNIDKLAKESIVFENNFTPIFYTLPSFMSIITSLYPKSHGVFYVAKDRLSPKISTLAEILKIYGYKTYCFGLDGLHLEPKAGFGRGVEQIEMEGPEIDLKRMRGILFGWLDDLNNDKFFLTVHTYNIHGPYLPSPNYKERFTKQGQGMRIQTRDELKRAVFESIRDGLLKKEKWLWRILGEEAAYKLISTGLFQGEYNSEKFSQTLAYLYANKENIKKNKIEDKIYWDDVNSSGINKKEYIKALYDALILKFDTEVMGPLVEKLKELKLYDKTIIIVFSDHGDELGEHGMEKIGKHATLYDGIVHVPFIMRVPWIKQGRRIKELTQTVDIMPTLLNLLDIPIPYYAQGISLVSLINENSVMPIHKYVFGYHPTVSFIRSKEWKLILMEGGEKELFYLSRDPHEQQNLCLQKQDIALKLESELRKWEGSLPSYKDQEHPFLPEIDEVTQEKIKRTGYW